MQKVNAHPRRGLSLYMSVLSALAIEIFTFLEFPHTTLFFALWAVVFALLTVWEMTHETKRSKKPQENRGESILPNGQKPLSVIDLDQVSEEVGELEVPVKTFVKGPRLRDRVSHFRDLEECFLVAAFAILSGLNLILAVSAGVFSLVF